MRVFYSGQDHNVHSVPGDLVACYSALSAPAFHVQLSTEL